MPRKHLPRPPSGEHHQVLLLAAAIEEGVSEEVAELMRVKLLDTRSGAAAFERLPYTGVGHRASVSKPQRRGPKRSSRTPQHPEVRDRLERSRERVRARRARQREQAITTAV